MHILQICDTLANSNGGPARNAFELNRALNASAGLQVDLVWIHGDREASVLEGTSIPRSRDGRPGPRQLRWRADNQDAELISLTSAVRALRQHDVVIVHGFYLPWIPLVLIAAFFLRKPVVLMPHGALTSYETSKKSVKKAWFRRAIHPLLRRTVRALAVGSSREAEDATVVLPGVTATVCGVGTSMVGAPTFREVTPHLRLLTLCRLAEKKRIDVAILAVRNLRSMGIATQLVIAGAGSELPNLQRLTREHSLDDSVRFVGEVTGQAKRRIFQEADVFLLPSEDENFGIVVAEALANGVPVVASEHVQAASVAAYSRAVKLVASPDPDAVARLVQQFAAEEQSSLREAALEVAAAEFGWERVAQRWLTVLREATGGRID